MKNIRTTILAVCLGTLGSLAVQAQGENTAYGSYTLNTNTTGNLNSAFGFWTLANNTTGIYNTGIGAQALWVNHTGNFNSALGTFTLAYNTTGSNNTGIGARALIQNTVGSYNTAVGSVPLYSNTIGSYNTALGTYALFNNTVGSNNIGIGYMAGIDNPVGANYNIDIGSYGGFNDYNAIRIGNPGNQGLFYAAGVYGAYIEAGVPVVVNSNGQLGIVYSSIRFKEDVHDMADASDALMRLRPVTYRYKRPYADGSKPIDYGLIAEEVAEVYPDLVVKGADGQVQTVQYQKLPPMLLNELQKEHKLLEQQEKTIELLEKRLAALEAAQPSAKLEAQLAAK